MADAAVSRINSFRGISFEEPLGDQASFSILPDAAKFVFRGRASSWPAVEFAFGVELPRLNRFCANGNRRILCLGPDEWQLDAAEEDPAELWLELSEALGDQACSLVDVSHRSDGIEISGTMGEYVLNHGCPLDLSETEFPVGMCTRTVLGKTSIVLSRTERTTFRLEVWRSFSMYVWKLLDDARQELYRSRDKCGAIR